MELNSLLGQAPAVRALHEEITYASRCDAKVLVTGESGVGKEVVARLIHAGSGRRRAPLITVNCAALTDTLLETELFGHVRGSFTGAYRDRQGALELAHRGTVFMDEVGETSPRMQGLLLRFLEAGEIQRVGSDAIQTRVDVRVIAATNRNLEQAMTQGTFRQDLFYRLNVVRIMLPPLRERRDDITALVNHFLRRFNRRFRREVRGINPDALSALTSYDFPGNVRELENVLTRAAVLSQGDLVLEEHLVDEPAAPRADATPPPPSADGRVATLDEVERAHIVRVWALTKGHKGRTCQMLGISRPTLERKLKKYRIADGVE